MLTKLTGVYQLEHQFVNYYLETYLSDDWKATNLYQLHLLGSALEQ